MNKLLFCLFLTVILLSGNLFAANGIVKGRIVDSETGDALPAANVVIKGTSRGAATDLRGYYIIGNIPPGEYTLKVSYIGYKSQELKVNVESGKTVVKDVKLVYGQVVKGELIVVTAQASGQYTAINQQLASNTISNIVSQTRIQELPDVNAAESIGRLPGVAIERSGGEATKVSIRGLSPKYNIVTVNGVRVPATGGDDRSVDLSLISSNMLDGIEVKKAITPDMDADALGGTVDLRLREALDQLEVNATTQGGYNHLQDYYGNYNFTGNVSNRFYDGRLGVIASFNVDNYNRSADKFSGDYRRRTKPGTDETEIVAEEIQLREENVTRGRTGASLLLDYRIPGGKITANSFYNRLHWDALYRINRMHLTDNRHYYDLEDRGGTTSIFTGAVGMQQDFDWLRYDVSVARTASRSENPDEKTWVFIQEANAFEGAVGPGTHPNEIPAMATNDSNKTALKEVYVWDTILEENQTSVQLNVEVPFRLGRQVNGYIKMGGKFRWLDRMNDEEQVGRDAFQYGNADGPNDILTLLDQQVPEWKVDSLVSEYGLLPIWVFKSDYTRSDFLDGEYPLGFVVDEAMMNTLTEAVRESGEFKNMAIGSRGRDYDGIERYQAGYIMAEFNLGKHITLLPGIRWEGDYSKYHGQRYREVTKDNIQLEPTDLDSLTNVREHSFWLPMVHLRVQPTDWLKIRLARTETLTRPDFIQYAPITRINSYQSYVRAANASLRPAHSTNYDAAISVYQSYVGLFTVAGFYKSIEDLIFQTRLWLKPALKDTIAAQLPGLNVPSTWFESSPDCDTYINNPFKATYKGFELDWQTHFWYLPSIFKGVVLNVNYTRIFSETKKQQYYLEKKLIIPFPPVYETTIIDSSRSARMPDQPAHIANITLGYDYKGFSARLSYLYQTDKVTYLDRKPVLDNFSGAYERWDLTLQQKLGWGVQIFANFTNLNSREDQNYRGEALINPTYIEYYGFTMDVGARYKF